MKRQKTFLFGGLVSVAILFSYCKKPTQFKEVQVANLFSLQVPVYLNATAGDFPFPVALQYNSDSLGVFLMVLDTNRAGINENTLKMYYDSMVSQPFIDSVQITKPQLAKVDNDSAYTSEMTGKENGIKVFYEIEAIATKQRYYTILTWAKLDKREALKPDMVKMLSSFRDISHKKI
jgi:hypothetical protein